MLFIANFFISFKFAQIMDLLFPPHTDLITMLEESLDEEDLQKGDPTDKIPRAPPAADTNR